MLDTLIDRIDGLRCNAAAPGDDAICWAKIPTDQPGLLCDDCWLLLATKGEVSQRVLLAEEPELPAWIADTLAKDPQVLVRANLASRPDLSGDARTALFAADEAGQVTRRLARRNDTSPDEQRILLHCTDIATLRILAGTTLQQDLRTLLTRHPDDGVRAAAAGDHSGF